MGGAARYALLPLPVRELWLVLLAALNLKSVVNRKRP